MLPLETRSAVRTITTSEGITLEVRVIEKRCDDPELKNLFEGVERRKDYIIFPVPRDSMNWKQAGHVRIILDRVAEFKYDVKMYNFLRKNLADKDIVLKIPEYFPIPGINPDDAFVLPEAFTRKRVGSRVLEEILNDGVVIYGAKAVHCKTQREPMKKLLMKFGSEEVETDEYILFMTRLKSAARKS